MWDLVIFVLMYIFFIIYNFLLCVFRDIKTQNLLWKLCKKMRKTLENKGSIIIITTTVIIIIINRRMKREKPFLEVITYNLKVVNYNLNKVITYNCKMINFYSLIKWSLNHKLTTYNFKIVNYINKLIV